MEQQLLEMLVKQGPLVAVMALGLYWLNKAYAAQIASNAQLIEAHSAIQQARIDAMEEHIRKLEARSEACEEDRRRLWDKFTEHTQEK